METPNQIIYGLGGFIIALFLSAVLGDLMFTPLSILLKGHPGVEDYVVFVGIGLFLVLWWAAYIALIRWQGKRSRQRSPQGSV